MCTANKCQLKRKLNGNYAQFSRFYSYIFRNRKMIISLGPRHEERARAKKKPLLRLLPACCVPGKLNWTVNCELDCELNW